MSKNSYGIAAMTPRSDEGTMKPLPKFKLLSPGGDAKAGSGPATQDRKNNHEQYGQKR